LEEEEEIKKSSCVGGWVHWRRTRRRRRKEMAQTRGGGGGKGLRGSGGKAVLMMELKNRILAALNKLADRDTQQLAVEDLERLSESLSSEGLSMFLSCLYETDGQQKSAVRRECIKLFGTLATLHGGEALAPHAPKIVANIVRRLKDPDSNIRDACVDAMGILASQIGGGGGAEATGAGGSINIFVKPLLEALGEQNRNLQVGWRESSLFCKLRNCCSLLSFYFGHFGPTHFLKAPPCARRKEKKKN